MAEEWKPGGFSEGFAGEDYDALRIIITRLGRMGSFDANDVLRRWVEENQSVSNAGDVATMLYDLEELGVILPTDGPTDAARRWELGDTSRNRANRACSLSSSRPAKASRASLTLCCHASPRRLRRAA